MQNNDLLNEFYTVVVNIENVNRMVVEKQNQILEQFISEISKLDDGFLTNECAAKALELLIPKRIYNRSKLSLDSLALAQKMFLDRMNILHARISDLWNGEGVYPTAPLIAIMKAGELLNKTVASLSVGSIVRELGERNEHIESLRDILNKKKQFMLRAMERQHFGVHLRFNDDQLSIEHDIYLGELECAWKNRHTCWLINPVCTENSSGCEVADKAVGESESGAIEKIQKPNQPAIHLCDPKDVKKMLSMHRKLDDVEKASLQRLQDNNGWVSLKTIPKNYIDVLAGFRKRFPHMSALADEIEDNLSLTTLGCVNAPLELFQTICILDGPPGIGKTVGLNYLANEFGVVYRQIGCAELTNSFDLSGSSRGWGTAKAGHIAKMLVEQQTPNGIIILDELDKMIEGKQNYPPAQALYTLLERETAKSFRDEYFDFVTDASHLNWVGTANEINNVPEPIRDRARILSILPPTIEQRVSIASSLYGDLLNGNEWGKHFSAQLNYDVASTLAAVEGVSIRGMKQVLLRSLSMTAGRNRGHKIDDEKLVLHTENVTEAICRLGLNLGGTLQNKIGLTLH